MTRNADVIKLEGVRIESAGGLIVESDLSYFSRRAIVERAAAMRAVTQEARDRRLFLAHVYATKAEDCRAALGA